ncbi:MAG: glucosaminidase domain-containing protein [Lewinellaceae bacterium]|nr:glucosaminidase domain-containing protein [Lewinellaceae bacterium]
MARLQQVHTTYNSSRVAMTESAAGEWIQEPVLWKLVVITALAYLLWSDKISIVLGPISDENAVSTSQAVRANFLDMAVAQHPQKRLRKQEFQVELAPGTLNNTTFSIDPAYAKRHTIASKEVADRQLRCRDYVERFAPIARAEMRKFGIPASIILAQGLLESNAGESGLSRATNNHFGMKCFSKQCKRGHCANFSDDSHKDFFVKYGNAWSSYRAHSEFLKKTKRYRSLFQLEPTDYRNWAIGLEKSGYATDKQYAEKLMALVQSLGLDRYYGFIS